jgi:putative ABC transport system ATP-binding protein
MDDPLIAGERNERGSGRQPAVPVALREVRKLYRHGQSAVRALDGVSAEFARHSFTAVMGPSGSGKSTLLHCAAGLERPSSGTVWLAGQDLGRLSDKRLTGLRRSSVGFVFQAFNLVPALTVRENVVLPLRLAGARWDSGWAEEIIGRVGLADRARHRPAALSGGQEQRVAIARALVARPEVIFCDEPTGALDSATAADVLGLLREAVDSRGQTVVMVTHDPVAASYADRVVFLADGTIVDEVAAPGAGVIAERLARLGGRVSGGAGA